MDQKEKNMKDNGNIICQKEKVSNLGQIKVIILVNLNKVQNMAKENIFGMMDQIMMDNGAKEKFMAKEYILG